MINKLTVPNVNVLSTIKNGEIFGIIPSFFCNNVPSLFLGGSLAYYIMPITASLPQVIDLSQALPTGSVTILPQYEGGLGAYAIVDNFSGNGCSSIIIEADNMNNLNHVEVIFQGVFFINGNANFPAQFNITQMYDTAQNVWDSEYGWVYSVSYGNFVSVRLVSGFFSSTTTHDLAICTYYDSLSLSSCSIIYNTPDQIPSPVNGSWVAATNAIGFNLVSEVVGQGILIDSASTFAAQGGFYLDGNIGTSSANFTIINPIQRGDLSGTLPVSSLAGKYSFNLVVRTNVDDDDLSETNFLSYATGDFNGNNIIDLVVAVQSNSRSYCGIMYALYDIKYPISDIVLNDIAPPMGSIIYVSPMHSCYTARYNGKFNVQLSTADVNDDGFSDLLVSGTGILQSTGNYSDIAYVVLGSPDAFPNGLTLNELTPSQGFNMNETTAKSIPVGLSALGRIDNSGRDAFSYTDENGLQHIMQLVGDGAEQAQETI